MSNNYQIFVGDLLEALEILRIKHVFFILRIRDFIKELWKIMECFLKKI